MSSVFPPRRPVELAIHIGGDDWAETLSELQRLADYAKAHGPDCHHTRGGERSSGQIRVETRDVSPEDYRAELDSWWGQQREEVEEPRPPSRDRRRG